MSDSSSEDERMLSGDENDESFIEVDPDLRLEGELEAPVSVEFTALELFKMVDNKDIDLKAPYQRGVTWNDDAQSALIESLLKNLYVAPVLFMRETDEDTGDSEYRCIDGKQRLTSIHRFFKGEIPCTTMINDEEEQWWYQKPRTIKKKHMPKVMAAHYSRKLEQVKIRATVYEGISDEDEREIFQRVQKGKPLAPAEKLAALPGEPNDYLKLTSMRFTSELLKMIHFKKAHKAAQFAITRAVWVMSRLTEDDSVFPRLPSNAELHSWITAATQTHGTDPPDSLLPHSLTQRKIINAVDTFIAVATNHTARAFCNPNELPIVRDLEFKRLNPRYYEIAHPMTRRGKPRQGFLSPVEFVLILVHISRNPGLHHGTLAGQIRSLRNQIHLRYPGEKKFNGNLARLYYEWAEELKEQDDARATPESAPESAPMEVDEDEDGEADIFGFTPQKTVKLKGPGAGPSRTPKRSKAKRASPVSAHRSPKAKAKRV